MKVEEKEILQTFHDFWFTWAKREKKAATIDDLVAFFDKEISAIGTGMHESGKDFNGVRQNFLDDLSEIDIPISLKFEDEKPRLLSPTSGMVEADGDVSLELGNEVLGFHLRFTTIFCLKEGKWLIAHNHVSIPASGQDDGQAYPIDELKAKNNKLRRLVEERTKELEEKSLQLAQEKEKAESLLFNILPQKVALEMISTGKIKPLRYDEVSVLFADFKEFTNVASTIPARRLVQELNDMFFQFDDIVALSGLEKIKTIGDVYMAVCGLPDEYENHANKCVIAAQQMLQYILERNIDSAIKWKIRVGIHSGPVVAGVFGKRKFTYDLWGDTVNLASRIESTGEVGRVNISAYTYDLVRRDVDCQYRGKVEVKGKGEIDVYYVND